LYVTFGFFDCALEQPASNMAVASTAVRVSAKAEPNAKNMSAIKGIDAYGRGEKRV
jgi:hypothetical protein